jgi:hypothetical protein
MKKTYMNIKSKLIAKINNLYLAIRNYFEQRWVKRLVQELTSDITDDAARRIYIQLLNNNIEQLRIDSYGSTTHIISNRRDRIAFFAKTIKKAIEVTLPIRGLVGIQPMSGPVGLVYALRYRETDPTNESPVKHMTLDVMSEAVAADTRNLQASYTIEAMQDMKTLHGIDVEKELSDALGIEFGIEAQNEILKDVVQLAEKSGNVVELKPNRVLFLAEDALHIALARVANEIARKTRRGTGNFIVTSPLGVTILQTTRGPWQFRPVKQSGTYVGGVTYVGDIIGVTLAAEQVIYKVYSSLSSLSLFPDNAGVDFLVGFKGNNGEVDSGYFWAPYITAMTRGVMVNPNTFQPQVGFYTRYGKVFTKPTEDPASKVSANYYGLVKVISTESSQAEETTVNPA